MEQKEWKRKDSEILYAAQIDSNFLFFFRNSNNFSFLSIFFRSDRCCYFTTTARTSTRWPFSSKYILRKWKGGHCRVSVTVEIRRIKLLMRIENSNLKITKVTSFWSNINLTVYTIPRNGREGNKIFLYSFTDEKKTENNHFLFEFHLEEEMLPWMII